MLFEGFDHASAVQKGSDGRRQACQEVAKIGDEHLTDGSDPTRNPRYAQGQRLVRRRPRDRTGIPARSRYRWIIVG